jgi:hypothetical protein
LSTFFAKATEFLRGGGGESAETETPTVAGENGAGSADGGTREVSIPLYVAACIAQIAGFCAVAYQIAQPAFAYFTIILTIIGMFVSYQLRRLGTPARLIKSGTLLLGLVFLYALRGAGVFGAIVPVEAQGSQEMLLVTALAFTATFCSFLLLTDEAVVFTCVWSIAIIGLTGTVNINRELIISFIVFLAAASFLLVHQNALANSRNGKARSSATSWPLIKTQLTVALVAWISSIVLGFLIAIPVQMVGRNLSLGTIIQRLKVPASATTKQSSFNRLMFDQLGEFRVGLGPVDDDPTERMTVLSLGPRYWRGRVYDQYTGLGWLSSAAQQGEDIFPEPGQDTPDGLSTFNLRDFGPARKKTTRETHRFSVNGGVYGPVYGAAEPRKVRAPLGRIIQRSDNSIGAGRGGGSEYEVESDVYEARPAELRGTSTTYPEEIRRQYLNTGPVNDELQKLMQEAVANAPTNPFDRAQAIRRYIANRCIYTREARAVPKDRDAVEFFLNDSKEGYCDLYASSMTVLCRYAGIPARVATGYAPGTQAEDGRKPNNPRDKRILYVLRGSDQHAWTEVYFNDYGWVVFDATQDTAAAPFQAVATPEPLKKSNPWEQFFRNSRVSLILVGLGLLGFLYVLVNEVVLRNVRARGAADPARARANEIAHLYRKTIRQIERRGLERPETMTPGEFSWLVREQYGAEVGGALDRLTRRLEQALYGPSTITNADLADAREASRGVRQAMAAVKKGRVTAGASGER